MNKSIYKNLLLALSLIALWQLTANFSSHFYQIFSSPNDVAVAFYNGIGNGILLKHIVASISRVLIGFILASIIGIPLAMVHGANPAIANIIKRIVDFLRPIPPIAWIPIAILLFGLGNYPAYFIVFLGAFPPIFINAYHGATTLPLIYRNVSRSFGITGFNFLWRIQFFYALPSIFVGLRTGLGMGWMSVIAAELIGSQSGLGYFIQLNRLMLRTDNIILGMIVIGCVGFLLDRIIVLVETKTTPWIERKQNATY